METKQDMEKIPPDLWKGNSVARGSLLCCLAKDDALYAPFMLQSRKAYRFSMLLYNMGGNGRLNLHLCPGIGEELAPGFLFAEARVPADQSLWHRLEVDLTSGRSHGTQGFLRIGREPFGDGHVLVRDIGFRKLDLGAQRPQSALVGTEPSAGWFTNDLDTPEMEAVVMEELEQQSWRGKQIVARRDERGAKCQSMEGEKSLLFVPVKVEPNAVYRLHIDLKRESGNGRLFCNFYANRSFDFPQVGLACEASAWSTFDVQVRTGSFPQNLPVVLRLWRSPGGTGSLLVKRVAFEKMPPGSAAEEPKLIASSSMGRLTLAAPEPPPATPQPPRHTRRRPRPAPETAQTAALAALPNNFIYSRFARKAATVLFVSELGDEIALREAFTANNIKCEYMPMAGDAQWLPSTASAKGATWVHIHVRRGTQLTPAIVDQIRNTVPKIIVTIWMEPGWPMFDAKLLNLLRSADIALVESDIELSTYRAAGCFNAELWDPGASATLSAEGGSGSDVAVVPEGVPGETGAESVVESMRRLGLSAAVVGGDPAQLAGAKVAVFAGNCPSRRLFGLMATGVPVLSRRAVGIMEWCEDGRDLRLFDTPDECAAMARQLCSDPVAAKALGDRGAHAASSMHSPVARARELAVRLGCFEALAPYYPKDRTSYTSRRVMCVMRAAPIELMACGGDEDTDFMAASFTECRDLAAKIVRFRPDLLHVHLEAEDDGLPWSDLLLDLRRRLPGMLVSVWHPGKTAPDRRVMDVRFSVDHILVGTAEAAQKYRGLSMLGVEEWAVSASPSENPAAFRSDMLGFAHGMSERRRRLLEAAGGGNVDLTVFIGTYNRFEQLRQAVESSFASGCLRPMEIIVNDAGSTDGTQDWLRKMADADRRVVPIFSGKRTSFTQAFNEALQIAKGKYICWLSDDILPQNSALSDMCAIMDNVSPLDMGGFCVRNSWSHEFVVRMDSGYHFPTVGCMFTETLRKFNGINMDYPFYSQDTDLDMRVMRLGGRIVACTVCRLLHNCKNDELRRSNAATHTNCMHDVKYTLAAWHPGDYSRFPYPTVLLVPTADCPPEKVIETAKRIKTHYMCSHMFVAGEASGRLDLRGPNSFLCPVSTTNARASSLFDLVVRITPSGPELAHPAERASIPFVRKMLLQE